MTYVKGFQIYAQTYHNINEINYTLYKTYLFDYFEELNYAS